MTDINIWRAPLDEERVNRWMTCEEDDVLGEDKIVDWTTSNWDLDSSIELITLNKSFVCVRKERGASWFPFNSLENGKNFFQATDFCNLLGGKMSVPRDRKSMEEMKVACEDRYPFTGWIEQERSRVFEDPYTKETISTYSELWNDNQPDNNGGSEHCTEIENGLMDVSCDGLRPCLLCNLTRNPQFELRGSCLDTSQLDVRYSLLLDEFSDGRYKFFGWKVTKLEWNKQNLRWQLERRDENRLIAFCNETSDFPLGLNRCRCYE